MRGAGYLAVQGRLVLGQAAHSGRSGQVRLARSGWPGQVVQVKLGKVIKVRLVGGQAAQTEYAGKRQKE